MKHDEIIREIELIGQEIERLRERGWDDADIATTYADELYFLKKKLKENQND